MFPGVRESLLYHLSAAEHAVNPPFFFFWRKSLQIEPLPLWEQKKQTGWKQGGGGDPNLPGCSVRLKQTMQERQKEQKKGAAEVLAGTRVMDSVVTLCVCGGCCWWWGGLTTVQR